MPGDRLKAFSLKHLGYVAVLVLAALAGHACSSPPKGPPAVFIAPADLRRTGTVSERFQSFNVEMIEVTGGRFWKPYKDIQSILSGRQSTGKAAATPAGMDPGLYQQRPPIDLSNTRLRKLAAALSPAHMRVSGTWANTTYFHDSAAKPPATPPRGFGGILTRGQWKGVIDFSRAAGASLVTSFATGVGTRDSRGVWTPKEARKLLSFSASAGGGIVAAEFMNEPTFAAMGGAPKGYDAAAYARDLAVFVPFARQTAPEMTILGPGSVGEGVSLTGGSGASRIPFIKSEDLLAAAGPAFDVFSYHFYGAVSDRCGALGATAATSADAALSEEWLSRTDKVEEFYRNLRDRFAPGKPLWLTETADAACGGNPWAPTFLDSFRYLDQLGRLARRGVQVVAHNTLASSDYGLLDENSLAPRPNYWAALLWRKFMGTTVLDAGAPSSGLHIYAHCLRAAPGGIALLVINPDQTAAHSIELPAPADRYTLSASKLQDSTVRLNGAELKLGPDDEIPQLTGSRTAAGRLVFDPATITFLAMPDANNASCR
jgi:hypothetical protein